MSTHRLDVSLLHAALDICRSHSDLTWKQVAERTGVSASTFSRMGDGHRPDVDALCSLIVWMKLPLDRFIVPSDRFSTPRRVPRAEAS